MTKMTFNDVKTRYFTRSDVFLPKRDINSHKGSFGKVAVLAGSPRYPGAGILALRSARSALMSGAGLVNLLVPSSMAHAFQRDVECETLTLLPSEGGYLLPSFSELDSALTGVSVVIAGPGLEGPHTEEIILHLIKTLRVPLVLDAGALTAIANCKNPFEGAHGVVITPHLGEFARLAKKDVKEISPLKDSVAYAKSQGITVHLKGHESFTALPDGTCLVTFEGTPALAKAGSGDVLSGIIGAMIAQGIPNPVATASVIHGMAGKLAEERFGEYGVLATDLIDGVARSVSRLFIDDLGENND